MQDETTELDERQSSVFKWRSIKMLYIRVVIKATKKKVFSSVEPGGGENYSKIVFGRGDSCGIEIFLINFHKYC